MSRMFLVIERRKGNMVTLMYDIFWLWKLKMKVYGIALAIIFGMIIILGLLSDILG